jgi:hypothetical protein
MEYPWTVRARCSGVTVMWKCQDVAGMLCGGSWFNPGYSWKLPGHVSATARQLRGHCPAVAGKLPGN